MTKKYGFNPANFAFLHFSSATTGNTMSKRAAEEFERGGAPLKGGERVEKAGVEDEGLEFEDEFEDEFESEDEILEAGVDGRPDAEREAEEKTGMLIVCSFYTSQRKAKLSQRRWR